MIIKSHLDEDMQNIKRVNMFDTKVRFILIIWYLRQVFFIRLKLQLCQNLAFLTLQIA